MRCLMFALAALLFVSCGETEKKRRTMGYKGEAKNNPFLAAQRFLEKGGEDVKFEHGLSHFDDETAMIFLPPSSINTVGRAKRLMQWVESGGHLVVMLEGGELGGNDFRKLPGSGFSLHTEMDRPGLDYLLDELDISLDDWSHQSSDSSIDVEDLETDEWEEMEESDRVLLGSEESEIRLDGEWLSVHHWADQGFGYDEMYENEYGSGEGEDEDAKRHRFLSMTYDMGRVTWLSDARPLRNRYIGYADHARFLKELTELSQPGVIIFSSGDGDGLFSLLWRHFRMAVVATFLAVLFWLWRHLPRFGPEKDIENDGLREFTSHVRGIGRFLWRHKRDDTMLVAMRAQVNRSLALQPGASHEGIFDQLSEKSGLPVESVIEAMTRENVREPGVMVRVIKNLQFIRNTLSRV